jgi:hypothetical protein
MPSRSRSNGSILYGPSVSDQVKVNSVGFTTDTGNNLNPNQLYNSTLGLTVRDNRQSISDFVGNPTGINSVSHTRRDCDWSTMSKQFAVENVGSNPKKRIEVTEINTLASAYAQDYMTYGHLAVGDGTSVARAKLPAFGQESLNGLLSLAESHELKNLVKSVQRIPVHLLGAFVQGAPPSILKYGIKKWIKDNLGTSPGGVIRGITDKHLEWRFGWQPFIQDVQAVMSALGSFDDRVRRTREARFVVRSKHKLTGSDYRTPVTGYKLAANAVIMRIRQERYTEATWYIGAIRTLSPDAIARPNMQALSVLREQLGITERNLLTAPWQRVPLSFVVDWFLPITDFIESLYAKPLDTTWFKTVQTWSSLKQVSTFTTTTEYRDAKVASYKLVNFVDFDEYHSARYTTYTRTPGINLDPPLYLPKLKWPTNLGKWFTLLELAIQKLK